MVSLFCVTVSFAISIAAFIYGVFALKKGGPMCFMLFIFAIGCYALKELWTVVNLLYYGVGQPNLSILGMFGCFCFLYSADFGQLDSVVDEGGVSSKSARLYANIAPVLIFVIVCIFAVHSIIDMEYSKAIWISISYIPGALAAYYNLKHLLLKDDAMGFLQMTKMCNYMSLAYIFLSSTALLFMENEIIYSLSSVLLAFILVALAFSCKKGLKIWEALI